jgi:predicted RNase H-like nuclease
MINMGVDSCPFGWIAIFSDENGKDYRIRKTFEELFYDLPSQGFCLVDIPIGLCNEPRLCDKIARSILGKRSSSVFSTPVLNAVYAETYEQAKQENFKLTGKYISKQAWNICPKIRDVNDYVNRQQLGFVIKEMHPEVCFWALNDKQPCKHYKKTQEGKDERLDILSSYDQWACGVFDYIRRREPRKVVADDDIIDALVGLVTLMTDKIISFPSQVQRGANGLISEMIFYNGEEV